MKPENDNSPVENKGGKTDALSGGPTGVASSPLERRAATQLAEELEGRGRAARVQEVRIQASDSVTLSIHSMLTVAASLIGLKWPAIGASICLLTIFSFYSERGLGLRLIGRLLPGRTTGNVLSPPPGPDWEEVEVIFATGYDIPDSYPVGEWLSRRFSGRLTTERILFYGGMIGTFAALMLRAIGTEDIALNLFQTLVTGIPMAVIAAQVDRRLAGTPVATQEDLAPTRDLLAAARQIDEDSGDAPGVGICLFGAEYSSSAGASAFFSDRRLKLNPACTVINLVRGARLSGPEVTGSEGDLMPTRMNPELAGQSPLGPRIVALRSESSATVARRRGLRATTVVARGEAATDLLIDAYEGSLPGEDQER